MEYCLLNRLWKVWMDLEKEWKVLILLMVGLYILMWRGTTIPTEDTVVYDRLFAQKPAQIDPQAPPIELLGEWEQTDQYWIPKNKDATLSFTIDEGPWRRIALNLNGDIDQFWSLRVGREYQSLYMPKLDPGREIVLDGEKFPPMMISSSPINIRLSPHGDLKPDCRLARVGVHLSANMIHQPGMPLPALLLGPWLPIALALFLRNAGRRTFKQGALIGGLAGIAMAYLATIEPQTTAYITAGTVAFFLGATVAGTFRGYTAIKNGEEEEGKFYWKTIQWTALGAIVGISLWTRWEQFVTWRFASLLPDAMGYREIALTGSFYQTALDMAPFVREPLFPALLRGWYLFAPHTETAGRLFALLLGVVPPVLTFVVGRRLFSPFVGIAAGAMMAFNPIIAKGSIEILRDDLLTSLFLALICVVVYAGKKTFLRAILFGLIGALLGLTRLNCIFLVVPLMALEAWRSNWRWRELGIALGLSILPLVPHLIYNANIGGGNILYSSDVHTRYYLNFLMIGQDGFPATLAAWNANPYEGGVVGATAFLKYLSPLTVIAMIVRGYFRIFCLEYPHGFLFFGKELLMVFGLIGAWSVWTRWRELWWVYLWFVVFMLPISFIAAIHLDIRLAQPAAPIILFTWALGIQQTWEWTRRKKV
jgi:4-amino-4-deoxy-L-arabinose transferase-like glycosyltransferase